MQRLLPPTLVLLLISISVPLGLFVPIVGPWAWPVRVAGLLPLVIGIWLAVAGSALFERAGTNIKTFTDPDVLVDNGLFAHSRNPMYLGFVLLLVSVAILAGGLSAWIGPIVFGVMAEHWYVAFEEERMVARFGRDYENYYRRVPRWLGPVGRTRG